MKKSNNIFTVFANVYLQFAFITVFGFVMHLLSLYQTHYANGWDSYFYLLQIQSLLNDGHLVSSRISFFYPLLASAKLVTGSYIVGWKVFASLCAALIIFFSGSIVLQITKNKIAALVSAFFILWSPHFYFFSSQYVNNLLGHLLFLIFLSFLLRKKFVTAVIFVIINILTHKFTGILSAGVLICIVGIKIFSSFRHSKKLLLGLIPVIALFFIPKIFAFHEFDRQLRIFSAIPQFFFSQFIVYMEKTISPMWISELFFTIVMVIFLCVILLVKKVRSIGYWIFPVFIIVLNFPFLRWDTEGFTYRFFLQSILFSGIITGLTVSFVKNRTILGIMLTVSILVGCLSIKSYMTYNPSLHDPEYHRYALITSRLQKTSVFNQTELFIAHKSLAEFIKFTTNKDAMPWIPEYDIDDNRLWRITADIDPYILQSFFKDDTVINLVYDYCIVKESKWQLFLNDVLENHFDFYDDYTTWSNPSRIRPAFLKKYRRKDD